MTTATTNTNPIDLSLVSPISASQEPASDASTTKDVKSTTTATKTAPQAFKREKRILDMSFGLVTVKADISKLSASQAFTLKGLMKDNVSLGFDYLKSFSGERSATWRIKSRKETLQASGTDRLKNKSKNHYISVYQKLLNSRSQHSAEYIKYGDAVGLEIECFIQASSWDSAARKLREELASLKVKRSYVKSDGSLNASDDWENDSVSCGDCSNCDNGDEDQCEYAEGTRWHGVELVVLSSAKDVENVLRACKALSNVNARVNKSCGLHVHLDARDVQGVDTRANRIASCLQEILVPMVPRSRRNNSYCRLGISQGSERYYAINKTSYPKHGTLEIRLHSGTIDSVKILKWVEILRAAQEKSRGYSFTDSQSQYEKIEYFCRTSNLSDSVKNYIIQRQQAFSPELFGIDPAQRQEESEVA